ncbi:MAG: NADH dehydrogenase [Bacteroidetes bacterium RIFCSPHIGHO2_02_FULL_44_7]|nr:MAG: NADH dehydrogenase [Bacteroidetes bacterium RIFCSPHIGHO2_02_FULL_44_7]
MVSSIFLLCLIGLPLLALVLVLIARKTAEKYISRLAFLSMLLHFGAVVAFVIYWFVLGRKTISVEELTLYSSGEFRFTIDLLFDGVSAVYMLVGSFVTSLIVRYSAYYMHMEEGYKRFFVTVIFFYLGYNFTVLSGNFETLFVGWEILGLSSFLLIAFYRNRYLPVRNAVKVFSIYRIGDVGILLAMWASHHLWHENISFLKLQNETLVHNHLEGHTAIGFFIAFCLLIAAAAKSAQLPFSSWLPRAMEGPTPSSAIFYGSLSVHFGVFLLLRTFPFWEHQISVRVLIGTCGILTAVIAHLIARVQSTIKTQVAYASISQIGLMFVEVALGLETIVLIHFSGNAFLRTYQLLISPSAVSYAIREQLYNKFVPKERRMPRWTERAQATIYVLSLKEWGLDKLMGKLVFNPMKRAGKKITFINEKNYAVLLGSGIVLGIIFFQFRNYYSSTVISFLTYSFVLLGLLLVLRSFTERKHPILAWWLIVANHIFVGIAVSFNEWFDTTHLILFFSGFLSSGVLGGLLLRWMRKLEPDHFDLNYYNGHIYEHSGKAFLFLLLCMALMGFPITPSFIGEDLILGHVHDYQWVLAFFYAMSYVMIGIALIRIYARLFLGPHVKTYHPVSLKSA